MGSSLCRRANGRSRATGVDGLYQKIVSNYNRKWSCCSNKHPKSGEKNTKKNKSSKKKPIISGPFPADPDRLEGDKWRYVILTRLDTDPPPERPPRTKRRRRESAPGTGIGRWGSGRRRSHGRSSRGRPPRTLRRIAGHGLSGADLMALVLEAYLLRPVGRSLPPWPHGRGAGPEQPEKTSEKDSPHDRRNVDCRRNGLLVSFDRVRAMAASLLS